MRFQQFSRNGDQYVLPADVTGLVRDGSMDLELFNITGLVRQGYDDAHSASIPLLVRYADTKAAARAAAPAGAVVRRALAGVDMAALDEKKTMATRFWGQSLTVAGSATPRQVYARRLAGGIQRVWLNGKVRASLDQSVPQIGAPVAWSHGLSGTGVTVAVLDTGIDTHHTDFVGRISAVKDFSGKGSVEDGHGHGTHVASIVAGSGAASDGRYKGVAPDAALAIGKVLDDTGSGSFDAVIAGMQWAAADSGARVVNMSLGGYPSDGTDPVSEAVNDLTTEYGTLFVIAAGNDGADEAVSSPAAADKALAVGSVSKSDVLSDFSSRGPRYGDGALKPDLTAPGEDIVAARPAGVDPLGEPVGEAYQRLSGTSMAAPHVAGSAALLAQEHPDWPADRLKAALMSTAAEVSGAGPYSVGTGRVDVARATTQPVTATGSVSTTLAWPNQGASKKQTVTWHNTGQEPVTLSLSAVLARRDGQAAPTGLLSLSADTITVAAGSDAQVDVTLSAQDGAAGQYGGILTARSADGVAATRTALSVYQEEEKYDLTVNLIDRDGAVAHSDITVFDLNHAQNIYMPVPGEKIRLPRGRYAIHSIIETARAGQEPTVSLISYPELSLDHDTAQTLDARDGKRMSVTPDNPAVRGGDQSVEMLSAIGDCACTFSVGVEVDPRFGQIYAATVPGTRSPSFAVAQVRRASEPDLELHAEVEQPFEVPVSWLGTSPPAQQGTLPAVYGGDGTPEDLAKIDAKDKLVLAEVPNGIGWDEVVQRIAAMNAAGAKLAMLIPTDPTTTLAAGAELAASAKTAAEPELPTMVGSGPTVQRFVTLVKAGQVPAAYASRPFPERRYELAYGVSNVLATAQVHRPKTRDLVAVRAGYYDNAADSTHQVLAQAEFFGREVGIGWALPVRAGQERTEYFTPGTWNLFEQLGSSDVATEVLHLQSGHEHRVEWNKAVAGPTFQGTTGTGTKQRPWAWRKDNRIDVILPMQGDSAGRPRVPKPRLNGIDSGSISLYRAGQLVGTVPAPDSARFDVPAATGTYRLVAEADRTADWWPLWTKVTGAWTFHSSADDDARALPLLTVRFDPAVDLHNRAPGGREFSFPAYVTRQGADTTNGATVKASSLAVDVSYNDGHTWQPATVTAAGDHWIVDVVHPTSGYASLRAKATDADGNTVEQSVVHAYQISLEAGTDSQPPRKK
jgi:subtilisin family serine protease